MKQSVRVIVFNADEEFSAAMRGDLLSIPGVQIVAELDELALVEQAVDQFSAEVLLMHLDPAPEVVLPVAAQLAGKPGLTVFVVSSTADAQHILTAMRAGVREFLTKPIDRALLTSAIEKLLAQSEASAEIGTLVSVIGTIGGCGASSLAVNLAVELNDLLRKSERRDRRSVAVVDLDFRYGQLGTMLDLQADYTIADLADTPEQLDAAMIDKAMVKHSTGVHLLARPNQFTQADHITAAHCTAVLSALQRLYDFVIVDGPNRFDAGGSAVVELADVNLLLIQLLVTSVRNVHRMLEGLRDAGFNLNRFRLVCDRVGRESSHLCVSHVEKTLSMKVAHEVPDDWKIMSSAINMGVPLIESAPKSKVRQSIREIAESLMNRQATPADEPAATAKGGLFGRIFSTAS